MKASHLAIYLALIVFVLSGSAWFLLRDTTSTQEDMSGAQSDSVAELAAALEANKEGLSPEAANLAQAAATQKSWRTYTNPQYGFSFDYPDTLRVGEQVTVDGSATTVVIQDAVHHVGFQIHLTPFTDPDTRITSARIQESSPELVIQSASVVRVGGKSDGLSFVTSDAAFGESRQVWMVYQGTLYQLSTYRSQDDLLQKVLATWHFTK